LLLRLPSLVRVEAIRATLGIALGLVLLTGLPRRVPGGVAVAVKTLLSLLDTSRPALRLTRGSTARCTDVALALTVLIRGLGRAPLGTELGTARGRRALTSGTAESHEALHTALAGAGASSVQLLAIFTTLKAGAEVALLLMVALITNAAIVVLLATVHAATVGVALALRTEAARSAVGRLAHAGRVLSSRNARLLEHSWILDKRLRYAISRVVRRAIELVLRVVRVIWRRLVALLLLLSPLGLWPARSR
jgi:hypothetical protein